jgi:hypothetical protein
MVAMAKRMWRKIVGDIPPVDLREESFLAVRAQARMVSARRESWARKMRRVERRRPWNWGRGFVEGGLRNLRMPESPPGERGPGSGGALVPFGLGVPGTAGKPPPTAGVRGTAVVGPERSSTESERSAGCRAGRLVGVSVLLLWKGNVGVEGVWTPSMKPSSPRLDGKGPACWRPASS